MQINGRPAIEDGAVRAKLADWYCKSSGLKFTRFRSISAMSRGEVPGPENSIGKLVGAFKSVGETPVQVTLSPRLAWQLKLQNGMLVDIGREQPKSPVGVRLARFIEVYPEMVAKRAVRPAVVDLRYPNGFAMRAAGEPPFEQLDRLVAIGRGLKNAPDRHEALKRALLAEYVAITAAHGCRFSEAELTRLLGVDLELNAQGLGVWLDSRQTGATGA